MRSALPAIAAQLGADERSLRRAAARGAVRCRRTRPRAFELVPGELAYLHRHWSLLSALTRALRTEPNVELAVLYGSRAHGTERPSSDVDVLVGFRDDNAGSTSALASRLEERFGIRVDVARLSRVRKEAPLLLLEVIDHGRVLVDRADAWTALQEGREGIARAARRHMRQLREQAAESLAQLTEPV